MGQINLSGNLQGGPPGASELFPSAQFLVALKLSQSPKGFQSASGVLTRVLSDAVNFVSLGAVPSDVPRCNFLYLFSDGEYSLRLTQDDGAGGTTVTSMARTGLTLMEFPDARALTLLEIASSRKIEYFVSGAT